MDPVITESPKPQYNGENEESSIFDSQDEAEEVDGQE